MNIEAPTWYLNQLCPQCGQGDSLTYVKCVDCGHALLTCNETQGVFAEGLVNGRMIEFDGTCLKCGSPVRSVTGIEMQELGHAVGEYH